EESVTIAQQARLRIFFLLRINRGDIAFGTGWVTAGSFSLAAAARPISSERGAYVTATSKGAARGRGAWRRSAFLGVVAAGGLAAALAAPPAALASPMTAASSHPAQATVRTTTLHRLGTVNLRALAKADASRHAANAAAGTKARQIPLRLPPYSSGSGAAAVRRAVALSGALTGFSGNVSGEHGFDGITAAINGAAN